MNPQGQLQKSLKMRHMRMISIGGVIGAGLFVGSGAVIHKTPGEFPSGVCLFGLSLAAGKPH